MTTPTSGSAAVANGGSVQKQKLMDRFPVNSSWEFTLHSQETVQGRVYCTDELSQTVVIQIPLAHTTLATEVRIINAAGILKAVSQNAKGVQAILSSSVQADAIDDDDWFAAPLPKVQKKALEDRERKAIRLAEERFRHINQKASVEGQAVFDRLLKACNDVVWRGESIIVLNEIQVDPPYGPDNCKIIQRSGGSSNSYTSNGARGGAGGGSAGKKTLEASLERVQKIVTAGVHSSSSS